MFWRYTKRHPDQDGVLATFVDLACCRSRAVTVDRTLVCCGAGGIEATFLRLGMNPKMRSLPGSPEL
jgi:hypothetical protein